MHLGAIEKQHNILESMEIPSNFRMAGWVYVLSNEFMPGIYKIGMTTTSPTTRAKELSSATGVPAPFKIEATFHCEDPAGSESSIHEALAECRINESREFFKEDLDEIINEVDAHCQAATTARVEELADTYDVICFESLDNLNLPDLFDDIGISVFGDRLAVAERLIRFGVQMTKRQLIDQGCSLVLHDGKAYGIETSNYAFYRQINEQKEAREKELIAAGIYGPQLPTVDEPLPF
ncbi:GIY-YIG nuclease family protein [Klebsiella oxytoca]|uniref:GIY-YIG nuclease family protein n=1 Tax=Klebsiella oxytoca TaxID=571 RepID=UPI002930CF37|nr:GIY-YIG nuclease family protein [Klebsiella oxytoca]